MFQVAIINFDGERAANLFPCIGIMKSYLRPRKKKLTSGRRQRSSGHSRTAAVYGQFANSFALLINLRALTSKLTRPWVLSRVFNRVFALNKGALDGDNSFVWRYQQVSPDSAWIVFAVSALEIALKGRKRSPVKSLILNKHLLIVYC